MLKPSLEGEGADIFNVKPVQNLQKENSLHFHACVSLRVGTNAIAKQFGFDGFSTDGFQNLIFVCVAKTIAVL